MAALEWAAEANELWPARGYLIRCTTGYDRALAFTPCFAVSTYR